MSTVERAGAYDNYYNHNLINGEFTVQALSAVANKYNKLEGTTSGSSLNASTMVDFKDYIDSYEGYIIDAMEAATWPEVTGYASAIAGLVLLVVGYATGPAGWVAIVTFYSGALVTFAGLTSTIYATNSRLQLSKNAQQNLENAQNLIFSYGGYFENVDAELGVPGF